MTDADYERLNPPDAILLGRRDGLYLKMIDNPAWLHMGWVPTPKTRFGWFVYHAVHGLLMRYPLWDVLVWSWKNSDSGGEVEMNPEEHQLLDEDMELDSPNWYSPAIDELKARNFVRINDPRKRQSVSTQLTEVYADIWIDTGDCEKCNAAGATCVRAKLSIVCLQCITQAAYRHEGGAMAFKEELMQMMVGDSKQ